MDWAVCDNWEIAPGLLTLADRYDPFGAALSSTGSGTSEFGFAGEQTDATGLEYLRARYYAPGQGRFVTKDIWEGNLLQPPSYDSWLYAYDNPLKYSDPSGMISMAEAPDADRLVDRLSTTFDVRIKKDWGYMTTYQGQLAWPFIVLCTSPWQEGRL